MWVNPRPPTRLRVVCHEGWDGARRHPQPAASVQSAQSSGAAVSHSRSHSSSTNKPRDHTTPHGNSRNGSNVYSKTQVTSDDEFIPTKHPHPLVVREVGVPAQQVENVSPCTSSSTEGLTLRQPKPRMQLAVQDVPNGALRTHSD